MKLSSKTRAVHWVMLSLVLAVLSLLVVVICLRNGTASAPLTINFVGMTNDSAGRT